MNEDDYVEFSISIDAFLVVDKIDVDDSDNDFLCTYIDAKTLAKHNNYALNTARVILEGGKQSIVKCFGRIVDALRHSIRYEFGSMQVALDKPIYEQAWVSFYGDVVLHGELNIYVQIKGVKSDNLTTKIERVVAAAIKRNADEKLDIKYEVVF